MSSHTNGFNEFIAKDGFIKVFETVFFIFWLITVPFYFFLLYFLMLAQRKRVNDLATPFFRLCISSGVIDLTNLLNNYLFAVLPKWGWFRGFYLALGQFFPYFYLYIAWSLGICQAMSVSVLATNRLSAMMFPETYHKSWTGKKLLIAYFIQFSIGMAISLSVFASDVYVEHSESGGLIPKFVEKSRTNLFFGIGGFFLGFNSLYLVIAYCYLFYILRRRHNIQIEKKSVNIEKVQLIARRRETRLFFMSTCIVSVQLVIILFFVSKLFPYLTLTTEQFYMFYNALSDIYSGVNPYLLVIFSDALRKYILTSLKVYKKIRMATTIIV
ncbi:unnamed protein product [Auanema sp. JU1783]|nr:unnamed protein product [Auanema sp. JU1783]